MVERRVTGKQQGVDTLPSLVLTCLCKAMGVTLPKKVECMCYAGGRPLYRGWDLNEISFGPSRQASLLYKVLEHTTRDSERFRKFKLIAGVFQSQGSAERTRPHSCMYEQAVSLKGSFAHVLGFLQRSQAVQGRSGEAG